MISAKIIADSINGYNNSRLTTFIVRFPRIVLSEINTHKMLCLSGDTILNFDLPCGQRGRESHCYSMSISDFYKKWKYGARLRKRHLSVSHLNESALFTAKEISKIVKKQPSSIRGRCRDGTIRVQNLNKKRNEDFLILGKDYNEYHNGYESVGFDLKLRLSKMKIRQLNEKTNKIQRSQVNDCFYSGKKEIYEIKTVGGSSVKCSKEHRILTEFGWKPLKDIKIGEKIYVQSFGLLDEDRSDRYKYKKINGKWVNHFLKLIRDQVFQRQFGKRKDCGDQIKELHHVEPVYRNIEKAFDKENVVGLCVSCHDKKHSKQGWQPSQYLYGKCEEVVSINYIGIEDTYDLEIKGEFKNFIANNIVVHNSKNSASSRARPFKLAVKEVKEDPFIPLEFQENHKGMQGNKNLTGWRKWIAIKLWLLARNLAVISATLLNKANVTKQLSNRVIEPFMWHTALLTATEWENFFALRAHPATEIHFQKLAYLMLKEYNKSIPEIKNPIDLNYPSGEFELEDFVNINPDFEWHLPFSDKMPEDISTVEKIKISVARAARLSYVSFDGETDAQKDFAIYDKLLGDNPKHCSPAESAAFPTKDDKFIGNLKGWWQLRKIISNENAKDNRVIKRKVVWGEVK